MFLRVFRTLHQFRGQSTLKTWIYRIVVNQASNRRRWWRRRHISQQVALDDPATNIQPIDSRIFASPDRVLDEREIAARVRGALDTLPFDQRTVIVLREIEGLSYDEIASSLGLAVAREVAFGPGPPTAAGTTGGTYEEPRLHKGE